MTSMSSQPQLYAVTDAARQVGCSTAYVRRLCARHDLGRKVNSRTRILSRDEVRVIRQLVLPKPSAD